MKKLLVFCLIALLSTSFSLSAQAAGTTEEVGQGILVGGAASGSGGLALIGILVENVGRILSQPSKGSPEFEAQKTRIYKRTLGPVLMMDMHKQIRPGMSEEQAATIGKEYCAEIARRVQSGKPIVLNRADMGRMMIPDKYMPDNDDPQFEYILTEDPFNGNCLDRVVPEAVGKAKQLSAKKE